jgi:murein L,D-transpeptidase YcbB/YkuD
MGMMKFMLPNYFGIYLHDSPEKEHSPRTSCGSATAASGSRITSGWPGGCSTAIVPDRTGPEGRARGDLPKPVPVYMTYLTVSRPRRA